MSRAQKRGKKFFGVLIKRVILEKIYGIFVGTNETVRCIRVSALSGCVRRAGFHCNFL